MHNYDGILRILYPKAKLTHPESVLHKMSWKFNHAVRGAAGTVQNFNGYRGPEEGGRATHSFNKAMFVWWGGHSSVYPTLMQSPHVWVFPPVQHILIAAEELAQQTKQVVGSCTTQTSDNNSAAYQVKQTASSNQFNITFQPIEEPAPRSSFNSQVKLLHFIKNIRLFVLFLKTITWLLNTLMLLWVRKGARRGSACRTGCARLMRLHLPIFHGNISFKRLLIYLNIIKLFSAVSKWPFPPTASVEGIKHTWFPT